MYFNWTNDNIWDLHRKAKETEEILAEPGEQCLYLYEYWYYGYCHCITEEYREVENGEQKGKE